MAEGALADAPVAAGSRPRPDSWQPLRQVLAALDAIGTRAEDTGVVHALLAIDSGWTAPVAHRAWALITGPYRNVLEDAGWDVDLLPTPPEPHPNRDRARTMHGFAAPSGTHEAHDDPPSVSGLTPNPQGPAPITVTLTDAGTIAVITPAGHPLRRTLGDLPGARWDGVSAWLFPATHRSARALRTALTGHRPITVTPRAAQTLRAAADSTPDPDVTVIGDRIEIRFEHTAARQDDVKRRVGATWDGPNNCWHAPLERADDAVRFAAAHDLIVHPDVEALAAAKNAPFDYDLTIDGLRGVPVTELHSVRSRPARGKTKSLADRFAEFGIHTVYDLLMTIPYRYLPRSAGTAISRLTVGEQVGFLAKVTKVSPYDRAKRLFRVTVTDGSADVSVTFFNAAWMMHRFRPGDEVAVHGRLDVWEGNGRRNLQMTNPIMDVVGDDTALIVPVYPQSAKADVTTWDLHSAAMEAVRRLGDLQDPLPADLTATHGLIGRLEAYRQVHHPDSLETAKTARDRLAFDELLRMQVALGLRRHAAAADTGVTHNPTGVLSQQFLAGLPFPLTGAQQRALAEINDDLRRPHPMHRLLQGDVGAGKSVCAFLTLLAGVEGGYQGALMAPTEILASQLYVELADALGRIQHPDGRPLVVEFYANKTKAKDRRRILTGLADGSVDIVVGTHALLGDDLEFANLGIVVVDEQHRFGVEQRAALRAKGHAGTPDMLVMTATPIPRTSALTVFGDLEVSILDELPPGRTPIQTTWLSGEPALDVLGGPPWDTVRAEVEKGRQAYVVASLVEDNENIAAKSANDAFESLQAGALAGLRLGLVHGKQPREEREQTMLAFKRSELDVLVATTVIEVGVNVPNATVMVVLDATRFGIAQLHQIRGRVGRGRHASTCILTGKAGSQDAVIRMEALCESTDGFYLSEVDLNLRGEGSIFGARQSGQTDLRVASLRDDRDMVALCRAEADTLLEGDPKLNRRPGLRLEVQSALGADAVEWLNKS